jgi:hypothetical protein
MKTYYDKIQPTPPLEGTGNIEPVSKHALSEPVAQVAPKRKRREGAKWADFSYWFNLIDKNKKELKPKERIELARWALEYIAENMGKPKAPEAKQDPATLLAALESTPR